MIFEVILFVGVTVAVGLFCLIAFVMSDRYEEYPDVLYSDMPDPYPELELPEGVSEEVISAN